jgi:transcriptional regulator with XRE-family HTH domain
MPRGVPSDIRVGSRTYTCRQIADGAGIDISLVSRIFRGQRAPSLYTAYRLAGFFRITIDQMLEVIRVQVSMPPRLRPLGRIVGRIRPDSPSRPPVLDRDAAARLLKELESEPWPPCTSEQRNSADGLMTEIKPFQAGEERLQLPTPQPRVRGRIVYRRHPPCY